MKDCDEGGENEYAPLELSSMSWLLVFVLLFRDKMQSSAIFCIYAAIVSQVYSAPQFITFQDGKLGVNFAGYHAGVGIGGLLANGTLGGLYAEAGTPTGQSATAGLGGVVNKYGHASGGLYAGATAGNNVQAAAGLSGGLNSEDSAGNGFATAQAGNRITSAALGGNAGVEGSSSYHVKEVAVAPVQHNVEAQFNLDSHINEVQPLPQSQVEIHKTIIKESVPPPPPVIVKEVIVESPPPPTQIVEKHIVHTHYKHKRPHLRKTAFVSGYIGGGANVPETVVYRTEPVAEKRVDVAVEANAGAGPEPHYNGGGGIRNVYRKEVSIHRNPTFFSDIFNIPISTLRAVSGFLGNTAANTNISVQKSTSVEAGSDTELKHDPSSSSSSSSHVSVQTPTASKFIDDIFSIPISTLGAVNRFLENNVARKNVQVVHEGVPSRERRVPKAHRRAKIYVEEP
ncbi:unnamed protein product [Leptosia nina]|uniref:Uncharacterized protein n=1 Tax=Leptosia nina TaxID=320188 RepID=A0AAV1K1G0_9NEOP